MKGRLKKLVNNRKGERKRKLGSKFNKHFTTISRQIKNIGINNYANEKTQKHTGEGAFKVKKRSRKIENLLIARRKKLLWMVKNTSVLTVITSLVVLDIIQTTKKKP